MQFVRNQRLQKMKLEIEIDEQESNKYKFLTKAKQTKTQIARMIKKTQTYLVD